MISDARLQEIGETKNEQMVPLAILCSKWEQRDMARDLLAARRVVEAMTRIRDAYALNAPSELAHSISRDTLATYDREVAGE